MNGAFLASLYALSLISAGDNSSDPYICGAKKVTEQFGNAGFENFEKEIKAIFENRDSPINAFAAKAEEMRMEVAAQMRATILTETLHKKTIGSDGESRDNFALVDYWPTEFDEKAKEKFKALCSAPPYGLTPLCANSESYKRGFIETFVEENKTVIAEAARHLEERPNQKWSDFLDFKRIKVPEGSGVVAGTIMRHGFTYFMSLDELVELGARWDFSEEGNPKFILPIKQVDQQGRLLKIEHWIVPPVPGSQGHYFFRPMAWAAGASADKWNALFNKAI